MKKSSKDRMFRQMSAKKKIQEAKKTIDAAKQPVTRGELYAIQNTLNLRTDKALMGVAAVVEVLVKNKLCTYEEFRESEKNMTDILRFIRKSMNEANKELGVDAKPEDIGAFVHEKSVAFGISKDILENIFGVRPSKSRIIKPNQVKLIVPK